MSFACPICLELIKESASADNPQTDVMATPCGHVFHRVCIGSCLNIRSSCPSCTKACYSSQVIRLFPTGDEETEKLIRDIHRKTQENSHLQDMVHEQNKIISDYRIKNSYITSLLESKQMQFEDVQHRCKFMETDARLKQATLNSFRENFATLKSKQDEKLKALGSCDPKLYEKSKEKYKSLLTRYKKLVDEKLLVEKEHGELLLANANIKLQYDTLLAQNESGNDDSESIKADKEKYKKLSDRFEKLTDTKNAIVHEKSNLEEEHEAYKKNNSTGNIDKLKNEFTELQQKFEDLELGHTNKVEEVNNLTQKKLSLKNKLKEAKLTMQKLEKVKRDYTKTIEDLTIGLRESQMQCEEQEKTHREAKRTKNRLIRDTNKLNKILQDKIISLESTIFKLNQELETFQGQTLEAKFILDIAKQEEMVHHCIQLLAIISPNGR